MVKDCPSCVALVSICWRISESCCFFVILLFKMKTAYEVRISDWSSDVCSSDLSALASMTYGMATHFAADGIRVNGIAPGIMETPASKGSLPVETYARVQGSQMLNLHGVADDIARPGVFLASDDARFITSEIVNCDAGNPMRKRKSVVEGKSVSVSVDLGGGRL